MSKHTRESSSSSNLSVDSLEDAFTRKSSIRDGASEDNVDTILVPFYEKDVLMKVPKEQKTKKGINRHGKSSEKKGEIQNSSYLVNKHKTRRSSYLEMFRKQLAPQKPKNKPVEQEIRSISPEVGDTEQESITEVEDSQYPTTEFYNTESYNEMYYEKLMTNDFESYLDNSYEETQYAVDDAGNIRSPHDLLIENLRSISEVSHHRRPVRRATIDPPLDNVKLGGLGPDVEAIKPRLDRARSLQRYSEKVRMENRLKIYKKSIQVDKEKKEEQPRSPTTITRQRMSGQEKEQRVHKDDPNASYLLNKSNQQKSSQILSKLYSKSKSADVKKSRAVVPQALIPREKISNGVRQRNSNENKQTPGIKSVREKRKSIENVNEDRESRAKSSTRDRGINTVNTTERSGSIPPVHINFMVNIGGARPSSALKSLEEKHRMYQEQVKAFKMNNNNL